MSALQKGPQDGLLDYDPGRLLHAPVAYPTFTQPPYVTHLLPSPLASRDGQGPDGLPYMADQGYAGPPPFEGSRSPIFGFQARQGQAPEVTSYHPQRGCEGTRIYVHMRCPYELSVSRTTFYLCFGSKRCECGPHLLNYQESTYHYVFSVDTPVFPLTGSSSLTVPLQLVVDRSSDHPPIMLQVGVYTYEQATQPPLSDDPRPRPIKTHPGQQIDVKGEPDGYSFHDDSNPTSSSYSPFMETPTTTGAFTAQYASDNSSPAAFNHYAGTSTVPQPALKALSPLTSSWNGAFTTANGTPMIAVPHQQGVSSPTQPPNPTLIRTSTIQQSNNLGQAQPFNPYAMYPTKAVLKLNGNLDSMTENWTAAERDAKRRLVLFTRAQNGSTIHTDFQPVSPEDRAPNSICISCIYWESKDECFVTSVDTIYLLESLVGVRFTVEEKNRIRRNLEGFRPLTVSKAKADSEDFFKIIMGFPAPKPRNIEKDVKVFPWKILGHALKKIIGKYSASYSSTAGALPTSLNAGYISNGSSSDTGSESQHAASPQSVTDSATSSTYTANLTSSTTFSPPMAQSKPSLGSCVTGSPEIGMTLARVSSSYAPVQATYSYQPPCQGNQPIVTAQPSWDFNPLVNAIPATVSNPNPTDFAYVTPAPYSMSHITSGV